MRLGFIGMRTVGVDAFLQPDCARSLSPLKLTAANNPRSVLASIV